MDAFEALLPNMVTKAFHQHASLGLLPSLLGGLFLKVKRPFCLSSTSHQKSPRVITGMFSSTGGAHSEPNAWFVVPEHFVIGLSTL